MVRVIYLGLFFWYEEFSHSTVIPLSFRFLTNSPHSPFIPLSFPSFPSFGFPSFPLSFPYHSPVHSVSPHFPLIPLSFGFLSFPCHSPHSVSQIPLGFPSFGFPSCIPSSLSVVLSRLSFSFPVLSRHSPVLWRSRTTSQIQGARGRRARPQGSAPHS